MATPGKRAQIKIMSAATPIGFINEAMTGDVTKTIYTINDQTKKYWSKSAPVLIEESSDGINWLPTTGQYVIEYAGGKITFTVPRAPGTLIRADGEYVTTTNWAEVTDYSMAIGNQLIDVTTFDSNGFRNRLPNLVEATGTVTGFYAETNLYNDRVLAGESVVIELLPDRTLTNVFAFYAFLESEELQAAIEGAVGVSIPYQSDGEIFVTA
jgi:hypothetical protein